MEVWGEIARKEAPHARREAAATEIGSNDSLYARITQTRPLHLWLEYTHPYGIMISSLCNVIQLFHSSVSFFANESDTVSFLKSTISSIA